MLQLTVCPSKFNPLSFLTPSAVRRLQAVFFLLSVSRQRQSLPPPPTP
jgi:hypothetical protein